MKEHMSRSRRYTKIIPYELAKVLDKKAIYVWSDMNYVSGQKYNFYSINEGDLITPNYLTILNAYGHTIDSIMAPTFGDCFYHFYNVGIEIVIKNCCRFLLGMHKYYIADIFVCDRHVGTIEEGSWESTASKAIEYATNIIKMEKI